MALNAECIYCLCPGEFSAAVCPDCAAIDSAIHAHYLQAQETWPEIELSFPFLRRQIRNVLEKQFPGLFKPAQAQIIPATKIADFLTNLKWTELFLTTACAQGNEAAWKVLKCQYQSVIQTTALCSAENATEALDLSNSMLSELFLPAHEELNSGFPKISQYHGIGSLEGWIRVVVARKAIDKIRSSRKQVSLEDLEEEPAGLVSRESASNLVEEAENRRASRLFSAALSAAFDELSSEEKLALKLYYCDDLNLKEIGRLLRVHESTISRMLDRLQKQLRKSVEKHLKSKFQVNPREILFLIENGQAGTKIDLKKMLAK
jgi:RNA polymerase sigma-70 factor (ECF subfamily)